MTDHYRDPHRLYEVTPTEWRMWGTVIALIGIFAGFMLARLWYGV